MRFFFLSSIMIFCIGFTTISNAQDNLKATINNYLEEHYKEKKLTKEDISNWTITNEHHSKQSGVHYVYIRQLHDGIPVFNVVANFAIKNNEVFSMGNRLVRQLGKYTNSSTPKLNPTEAIQAAAKQLNLEAPKELTALETKSTNNFIYNKGQLSKENIPVQLMYHAVSEKDIRLVWDLSIYTLDASHWWSVRIDAHTGDLLDKNDWVVHCNFEHSTFAKNNNTNLLPEFSTMSTPETTMAPDQYEVFALPLESPNHGNRTIVINPSDALASPYGWHDTNGSVGPEYTITRGNNVFAYEDLADMDAPGFSPDGGANLDFIFPYDAANLPNAYQSAAITNLFYMNNMMHDVWYHYGFDEASGNFQSNNYGRGGAGSDDVRAEAQDGGGTNNANFATPPDGNNPRMQMYLFTIPPTTGNYLTVNSPASIADVYVAADASFGPSLPSVPITANVVLAVDTNAPLNDACDPITNAAQLAGKIALIDRGTCNFTVKVEAAQNAGAVAVIIVNNVGGTPSQMGGTSAVITIPSIIISQSDGDIIKTQLSSGTVNATISDGGVGSGIRDSDLDNGLIAHEYGHGISTRLTGGSFNSDCLNNAEQMGEGWSDWFGLMLTIEEGDLGSDVRGFGTYSDGQPITGNGIRPAPYSTDFAVNNYTYAASNNAGQISEPHGIGFIFATALWDLTWALVDEYGGTPDADLINGTGGNNIAMQLVIEALKLQPCNPGMIDGRDAILQADQLLYGGIHQCLIWDTFAKRGFGYSASQGSSDSRTDQVEAFDLPQSCQTAVEPPVSNFSSNKMSSCNFYEAINFIDGSTSVPETWSWDFGDGMTSELQNPSHNYTSSGVYTVQLTVTNSFGSDTSTMQITVDLPPAPIVSDVLLCAGETATVTATVTGYAQWKDTDLNIVHIGNTLVVPDVQSINTYYVENIIVNPSEFVGPVDSSFGTGGYHASGYHGALNFTANKEFEIVSAWVDADGAGPRTFYLASGTNNNGASPTGNDIIDSITVDLVNGPQRIDLNLTVPSSGSYNIGGNNVSLYRNNAGANFPYTLDEFLTIDSSSAGSTTTGYNYYYLYDIEVRDPQCNSSVETVTITPIISDFSHTEVAEGVVDFTDMSTGASDWLWTFGDGESSTDQNPTHTYASNGNYTVILSINGGACEISYTVNVGTVLNIDDIINEEFIISVFPNPADNITKLILNKTLSSASTITIYSMDGKKVKSLALEAGQKEINIPLEKLASQIYILVLINDAKKFITKIIVE